MALFSLVETRLVKNLLRLETCILKVGKKGFSQNKNYLMGFRKGVFLLDIETSIGVYFKVLGIVRNIKDKKAGSLLFVGFPFDIEKRHFFKRKAPFFFSSKKWKKDNFKLSQKKSSFSIVFSQNLSFSYREFYSSEIPLIGFLNYTGYKLRIDYPIILNLDSKGSLGLFFYLINQST